MTPRLLSLALLLSSFAIPHSSFAADAREPLSCQTTGFYGRWNDYFHEAPFDFYVLHAEMGFANHANFDILIGRWRDNLRRARAAGKRVIADLYRVRPPDAPPVKAYSKAETDFWFEAIDRFLSHVAVDDLYAVTLGEENIFWDGRHQMLTEIFTRVKAKYPTLPVWQWYSNTGRATDCPGFQWPWLPADGYMVDEYTADAADFEQMIRRFRLLGAPVVQLAYAAPENHYGPVHRSIFDGQVRVARQYNVPLAFFGHQDIPISAFGWQERAGAKTKEIFQLVLDTAAASRKTPPATPASWDLRATPPEPTVLAAGGPGQFSHRESFDLRMQATGEVAPKQKGGWDFVQRVGLDGLRHLRWLPHPSRIAVLPDAGAAVKARLTQHWITPGAEPGEFAIAAQLMGNPRGSTKVILEASANGEDWTARTESVVKNRLSLVVPGMHTALHTRLRIVSPAGIIGDAPLAEVDWIEVSARHDNSAATPERPGK